MTILGEIRKRPVLIMGIIALALLAFLVNPDTIERFFGKNPEILGKVNGEKISREEYQDQLYVLQQQAQQQGQPTTGLEEQAWQMLVQSKLIKQQFDKMGLKMTDELFWNQLQYDPMFSQNPAYFDEKGNFKVNELKKEVEAMLASGDPNIVNQWNKTRRSIEYRIMGQMLFTNISHGITTGKKEAESMMRQRDNLANIDLVKVDYSAWLAKNPVKVSTQELKEFMDMYPHAYKTDPTVNIGVAYFPATASAADEKATLDEINKLLSEGSDTSGGTENFQNTKNDSLFISMNSDVGYMSGYAPISQLPQGIAAWVGSAAPGQIYGPYKEQNVYVVSKLIDKKPSDSILSKHILIAYKGAERSQATRSKEEAKKIAEDLYAKIKADPAQFNANLAQSDEPGAAERGGSVGWVTPEASFDPAYMNFLTSNAKGATGLVESAFGYHIINIEDKKSGAMGYKVANLVKAIRPSTATEADVDKKARRFIQQAQGKSFNDFMNLGKKTNYNVTNPKLVKRFDGMIPGVGTTKDAEVIAWAFNKDRKAGDTEMFTVDGTGDRIVVYYNSRQEKGQVNPESVREQIEPVVKNRLAARQIIAKINAGKYGSLDQIAAAFGAPKQSAQVNLINPQVLGAMEPKVAGAAFGVAAGKLSKPVEGMTGVYVVVKKNEVLNRQPGDIKQVMQSISAQNAQQFGQMFLKSLQDNADIEDYRIEVWDKVAK